MATRFYFPASGTPPLASLVRDSNWELPTGNTNPAVARLPCFTTKQNTALATTTLVWPATATQDWLWWQFQSEPLSSAFDFLLSHDIRMVLGKCGEAATGTDTYLAFSLRVVSNDGSVVRGTLKAVWSGGTEYPLLASAATRIIGAIVFTSAISAQAGDRLILEIGVHGITPTATQVQHRIGDPSATADFALTAGLTTDLCSWWEITPDLTFGEVTAVGDTIQKIWNIRQAVPDTSQYVWHARQTIGQTRQALWNTLTSVFDTSQYIWNVLAGVPVGDTFQLIWHVRQAINKTTQSIWNVRAIISDTFQTIWHVLIPIGDTIQHIWHVRQAISKTRQFIWDVLANVWAIGKALDFRWYVGIRRLDIFAHMTVSQDLSITSSTSRDVIIETNLTKDLSLTSTIGGG